VSRHKDTARTILAVLDVTALACVVGWLCALFLEVWVGSWGVWTGVVVGFGFWVLPGGLLLDDLLGGAIASRASATLRALKWHRR
jgi:hypothetical protein